MSIRTRIAELMTAASRIAARGFAVAAIGALSVAAFAAPAAARQSGWVQQSLKNHINKLGKTNEAEIDFSAPSYAYGVRPVAPRVAPEFYHRCTAAAFTYRGRQLGQTHAVADRLSEGVACQAALNSCEAKLDRKRAFEGRGYRYARCEITRSQEIATRPGDYGDLWSNVDYRY